MEYTPEQWGVFQRGWGLTMERVVKLYGKPIGPATGGKSEIFKRAVAAQKAATALLEARFGDRKTAMGFAPRIYGSRLVTERALLVKNGDAGFVPIAHVGPEGFELLMTEDQMLRGTGGRKYQDPPPGGFAKKGVGAVGQYVVKGAEQINKVIQHPVPRAVLGLTGAFLTLNSASKLFGGSGLVDFSGFGGE